MLESTYGSSSRSSVCLLTWILNGASSALFDLVDDGTLTREEAVEFYVRACLGALSALVARG